MGRCARICQPHGERDERLSSVCGCVNAYQRARAVCRRSTSGRHPPRDAHTRTLRRRGTMVFERATGALLASSSQPPPPPPASSSSSSAATASGYRGDNGGSRRRKRTFSARVRATDAYTRRARERERLDALEEENYDGADDGNGDANDADFIDEAVASRDGRRDESAEAAAEAAEATDDRHHHNDDRDEIAADSATAPTASRQKPRRQQRERHGVTEASSRSASGSGGRKNGTGTGTGGGSAAWLPKMNRSYAALAAEEADALFFARAPATAPTLASGKRRHLCSVCGYRAPYTCARCGAYYCSRRCSGLHAETRCLKFMM